MFIVLYKWRLKPGHEKQFIDAWSDVTVYFREHSNSLGSRLLKGSDGVFYGYAQWRSAEDREKAMLPDEMADFRRQMQEAIEQRFDEVVLEDIANYWA